MIALHKYALSCLVAVCTGLGSAGQGRAQDGQKPLSDTVELSGCMPASDDLVILSGVLEAPADADAFTTHNCEQTYSLSQFWVETNRQINNSPHAISMYVYNDSMLHWMRHSWQEFRSVVYAMIAPESEVVMAFTENRSRPTITDKEIIITYEFPIIVTDKTYDLYRRSWPVQSIMENTGENVFDIRDVRQSLDCAATDVVQGEYNDVNRQWFFEKDENRSQGLRLERNCLDGQTSLNLRTNHPQGYALINEAGTILSYGWLDCNDGAFLAPASHQAYCDNGFSLSGDELARIGEGYDHIYLLYGFFYQSYPQAGNEVRGPNTSPTGVRNNVADGYFSGQAYSFLMVNRPRVQVNPVVRLGHRSPDSVEVEFTLDYSHQISAVQRKQVYDGKVISTDTVAVFTRETAAAHLHSDTPIILSQPMAVPPWLPAGAEVEFILTPLGYGQRDPDEALPQFAVSATAAMPVDVDDDPLPNDWSMSVYPNPSAGQVTLDIRHPPSSTMNVLVFDLMGRQVYETGIAAGRSLAALDLGHLPSGVYRVRVVSEGSQAALSAPLLISR